MRRIWGSTIARFAILLLATVAILAAMLSWLGTDRLLDTVRQLGWQGVLWLLAIYSLSQLARALRTKIGLAPIHRPPFTQLAAVAYIHQFCNQLMPARLGELAFPYLLQRHAAVPQDRSLALLFRFRLQELSMLGTFFLVSLVILACGEPARGGINSGHPLLLAAIGLAVVLSPIALERALPPCLRAIGTVLARVAARRGPPPAGRWLHRGTALIERLEAESRKPFPLRIRIESMALTIVIWLLIYLLFHQAMRLSGYPISFPATIVGASFANLAQTLPLNTWGSIGSMELGWTAGFGLMGVPAEPALATGLVVHLLVLVFLTSCSIPAWFWLKTRPAKQTSRT